MEAQPISFSVIIPVLNEAATIDNCITAVRMLDPSVEVIVADGGSRDETVRIAQEAGAVVCSSQRGRGPQMNAGAACASGDVLLFLHADTTLPANAFHLLRALFQDEQVQIARFRLQFDTRNWILALAVRFTWFDSPMTSYGDQCIVVRRAFFGALGGFPEWPLFEDVRLFELARQQTRVQIVPTQVVTSARRFMQNGIVAQFLHDLWLIVQYRCGVSPGRIAAAYERKGAKLRDVCDGS